ncbi:MAG: cation:proton antiporter [Alphaproteobacteria bacterium]
MTSSTTGPVILAVFGLSTLLCMVSLLLPVARRLNVPYTVLLALFGLTIGIVGALPLDLPDVLSDLITALSLFSLSSEAFFYVFLPPLLFSAGLGVNVRRLMDDIGPVILLAVVAVVVCTAIVGIAAYAVAPEYGLVACLVLASIVATTDSSAVVGIFRDLGAPTRLSIIVEGESLFNDAAAIAIFVVLVGLLTGDGEADLFMGMGTFLVGLLGGFVFGYLLARIFVAVIGALRNASLTEITLTITLAYLTFIVSELYLGVSGVIAVVTAAMVIGSEGRTRVSPGMWGSLRDTWQLIDFVATSLIFTFAAMLAPAALADLAPMDLWVVLAVLVATVVARALVLYGLMPGLSVLGVAQPISGSYKAVLVWGGLRGAVTVALALAISENPGVPEETQRFILVSATSVVLLTLVVMAPTIRPLMSGLGLNTLGKRERVMRDRARRLAQTRAAARVKAAVPMVDGVVGQMPPQATMHNTAATDCTDIGTTDEEAAIPQQERCRFGFVSLAGRERELYLEYFRDGFLDRRIADDLRAHLGRMVDAVKSGGREDYLKAAVAAAGLGSRIHVARWLYNTFGLAGPLSRVLSDRFEMLIIMQLALRDLDGFLQNDLVPLLGGDVGDDLVSALTRRRNIVAGALEVLDLQYPAYAEMLRSRYVERVALVIEGREYIQQRDQSVIGNEVYKDLEQDRRERARALERRPDLDLGLRLTSMLQKVPLFNELDAATLKRIARVLVPRFAAPGEMILRQGELGDSMYFIAAGEVEVLLPDRCVKLGEGEFFGEVAIVTQAPRNADVRAAGFCTLLVLDRKDFQQLIRGNRKIARQIEATAAERARMS